MKQTFGNLLDYEDIPVFDEEKDKNRIYDSST